MSAGAEVLVGLAMVVGLVGVVVPVLPGLLLIWVAGLAWVLLDGGGLARWSVLVAMTVLLILGSIAKYVLPARSATTSGAPRSTLLLGALGAVVGLFVIPVVGLIVGGVGGVMLAEWSRLGDRSRAWRSTRGVLLGFGIGVLIELIAAVLMVMTWVGGTLLT